MYIIMINKYINVIIIIRVVLFILVILIRSVTSEYERIYYRLNVVSLCTHVYIYIYIYD